MTTNNEIEPYDQYDNNFISKLLGEMKNKFNKTGETGNTSEESKIPVQNIEDEITEETEESKNPEEFKKPSDSPGKSSKDSSPGRRSFRQKTKFTEEKSDGKLKRSSRNRSKESVLQNAIARKEKSYNESNKPQRLSRQLRPTQKVLENIAQAKEVKKVKMKITSDSDNEEKAKKSKISVKKNKKTSKRLKYSDSESDSNNSSVDDDSELGKNVRKSRRISGSKNRELNDISSPRVLADVPDPKNSASQENLELAARLCLCTEKTNFYQLTNDEEVVHCAAIDNIDERLVGCTREVNVKMSSLLRPSRRVPYMSLCELHKNRLIRHNCCPACGIFCTQGKFAQCQAGHQYHRKCRLSVGNKECCPHCGVSTPPRDISLKFRCSNNPVFLPVQKLPRSHAKMAFCDLTRCTTPLLIPLDSFSNIDNPLTNGSETAFSENDILDAIKHENVQKLATIVASNSIDSHRKLSDFNEGTLLHYAAYRGASKICHALLSLGFHIDEIDKEQNTPLMLAIMAHKTDAVQYLVRAGADVALKGTDGMTALHVSSKCGNLRACKILLESGASVKNYVNCQDDGGWTPLVWACENGFAEIADFLIAKGADALLRDVEHNEALHWAAFSGCSHIVELLANKGCDVNTVNAHGETPLHIAAREDRYNCAIVLLARGANVFSVNKNNETPLNCVPEGGMSCDPIILNIRLRALVESDVDQQRTVLSDDISKGRESNPVRCINDTDEDLEPKDYVYITKSFVASEGLSVETKPNSQQTCSCEERCTEDCLCGRLSVRCWYDEDGKLSIDFNYSDTPMIFECSDTCLCNAITCRNRVVQRGSQQRFQLYKTEAKGWAVRTLKYISRGCYVCEYVGEILTDDDADRRDDDSFLFDLGGKDDDSFCIDAQFYGNFTRFINHSCSPNLHPIKVFVEHQDLRFPRVAFFALKDIDVGDELSFDYGPKFWLAKCKSFTCRCGSDECRYSEETVQHTFADVTEVIDEDSCSS